MSRHSHTLTHTHKVSLTLGNSVSLTHTHSHALSLSLLMHSLTLPVSHTPLTRTPSLSLEVSFPQEPTYMFFFCFGLCTMVYKSYLFLCPLGYIGFSNMYSFFLIVYLYAVNIFLFTSYYYHPNRLSQSLV